MSTRPRPMPCYPGPRPKTKMCPWGSSRSRTCPQGLHQCKAV